LRNSLDDNHPSDGCIDPAMRNSLYLDAGDT